MGERDKLPEEGRLQTQGRKDNAATPLAEGGEKTTPQAYPPVAKDDSVQPDGEKRSFEPRRRDEQPDPSVSHGGMDSGDDSPDAGRT